MGKLIEFKAVNKVSHVDTLGKPGELVEFPRRPMAARAMWQRMDFETAQVMAFGMDTELIADGSCWVLVKVKDSAAYVFLIDSAEALFTVVGVDEFEAMRPELECWAGEVFSWLRQDAAGRAG